MNKVDFDSIKQLSAKWKKPHDDVNFKRCI